jgi:hypothetical protein
VRVAVGVNVTVIVGVLVIVGVAVGVHVGGRVARCEIALVGRLRAVGIWVAVDGISFVSPPQAHKKRAAIPKRTAARRV